MGGWIPHFQHCLAEVQHHCFFPSRWLQTHFISTECWGKQHSIAHTWAWEVCGCPFTRERFIEKMVPLLHYWANWSQPWKSGPRLKRNVPEQLEKGALNLWAFRHRDIVGMQLSQGRVEQWVCSYFVGQHCGRSAEWGLGEQRWLLEGRAVL